MQRYYSRVKPKDSDGNEIDDETDRYPFYDEADLNPHLQPCGGAKPGRAHFDAEAGSKAHIMWRVKSPDSNSNCTIRLGGGLRDDDFETLTPLDGSADSRGQFPCGRNGNAVEAKEIAFPKNFTCDDCTLQLIFNTKAAGKLY